MATAKTKTIDRKWRQKDVRREEKRDSLTFTFTPKTKNAIDMMYFDWFSLYRSDIFDWLFMTLHL
jgi:hypothetical protein